MAKEWKQTFLTGFKLGPGVLDLAPSFLCFCFLFLSLRSFLSFLFLSIAFPVFFVCCSHPSIILLSLIPLSLFLSFLKMLLFICHSLFLFLSLSLYLSLSSFPNIILSLYSHSSLVSPSLFQKSLLKIQPQSEKLLFAELIWRDPDGAPINSQFFSLPHFEYIFLGRKDEFSAEQN